MPRTFEEWCADGEVLLALQAKLDWVVGDWWRKGDHAYGERAAQVLDSDWHSFQSFRNAGWVAGRFEASRRRDALSFSHHSEVASLDPDAADALLDQAEEEGWTRNELRREVHRVKHAAQIAVKHEATTGLPTITIASSVADLATHPEMAPYLGHVDVIVADPPYERGYLHVYAELAEMAARVLHPSGSLAVMCSQPYLPDVLAAITPHLRYHWTLACLTSDSQASGQWKVNTSWRPVLWFVKGEYDGAWIGDVAENIFHFSDRLTEIGDVILEPFVGSDKIRIRIT